MSNKKIKSGIFSFVLLCFFVSIFFFNHFVFVTGSAHAIDNEYKTAQAIMVKENTVYEVKFLNRLATNDVYYVSEGVYNAKSHLLWYNKEGKILFAKESYTRKDEKIKAWGESNYHGETFDLKYGVYRNKPVYALVNNKREIYLDYDTQEKSFEWNKE